MEVHAATAVDTEVPAADMAVDTVVDTEVPEVDTEVDMVVPEAVMVVDTEVPEEATEVAHEEVTVVDHEVDTMDKLWYSDSDIAVIHFHFTVSYVYVSSILYPGLLTASVLTICDYMIRKTKS